MTPTKKIGWQILAYSCIWKLVLIVAMLHGAGCVTIDEHDCGGTTVVVVEPPSDSPDAGVPTGQPDAGTPPDASDPTGPSVPMAAPVVSLASVPTNVLTSGTIVAMRFTVTARAESDVEIRRLSFAIGLTTATPSAVVEAPHLRVVGQGADLAASADVNQTTPGHCGDLIDAPTYPCYRVVLAAPLAIPAGTSTTLDLRVTVDGGLTSGDTLISFLYSDFQGEEEGPLVIDGVNTHIKGGAYEDAILWSNDSAWFYNGQPIIGTNYGQVLTR